MKQWMQPIRGAIGMGLTWAFAWFGAGVLLLLVVGFGAADVPFPLFFGFLGFLAGVTFSGILRLFGGRRRFDEMSLPGFAAWGAVGGFLLSLMFVLAVALSGDSTPLSHLGILGPLFAAAGAGCASGSLALARKAEDRELLEAGRDGVEVRLSK